MTVNEVCWICGSHEVAIWKKDNVLEAVSSEDVKVTDSRYGVTLPLYQCASCGFIFAEREKLKQLTAAYAELEDPEYSETSQARIKQMQWLIRKIKELHPGAKNLLDIGAGTGLLVEQAQRAGFEAAGIEPCRSFVEKARQNGLNVLEGEMPHPQLQERQFDLITLVDVIEHVSDPLHLLQSAKAYLKRKGIMCVVTPNIESWTAKIMGQKWWHLRMAHVGYFSPRSLEQAAAECGLRVVREIQAIWFLPLDYVLVRLGKYLPSKIRTSWNRMVEAPSLAKITIPINLFDSTVTYLKWIRGKS